MKVRDLLECLEGYDLDDDILVDFTTKEDLIDFSGLTERQAEIFIRDHEDSFSVDLDLILYNTIFKN